MKFYRLKPELLGHIIIALAWLGFLAAANRQAPQPVTSIFPYLAPVVFLLGYTMPSGDFSSLQFQLSQRFPVTILIPTPKPNYSMLLFLLILS
ncbi:hypothetical protein C7H10_16980 [Marinobacter shengliensis]|nr:hypothetical protein C7H10_16980 [Marinobacter shengliensis]